MGDDYGNPFIDLFSPFHRPDPTQTKNLYAASSDTFFGEKFLVDEDEKERIYALPSEFRKNKELRNYLEGIRKSTFVKNNWPKAFRQREPIYRITAGDSFHGYALGRGAATDIHQRSLVFADNGFAGAKSSAIHELAHLIEADEFGPDLAMTDDPFYGHGSRYARINIMLVSEFLGKEIGAKLEANMRKYNVQIAEVYDAIGY